MNIVVVGGTGLIGSKLSAQLAEQDVTLVVASRPTGVNSFRGEGLAEALDGAHTVIDTTNSSYTDYAGAKEFFYGSTLNLLTYAAAAGVSHHVALSIVGTDRLAQSEGGYFAAKLEQERLIRTSGRPFSIVHATQFFEFLLNIADSANQRGVAGVAKAFIQPMAADDVAEAMLRVAAATWRRRCRSRRPRGCTTCSYGSLHDAEGGTRTHAVHEQRDGVVYPLDDSGSRKPGSRDSTTTATPGSRISSSRPSSPISAAMRTSRTAR